MVNSGIGWSRNNWELNLRVKNLTDVRHGVQGFDLARSAVATGFLQTSRFIQLGLRYSF